MPFIIYYDRHVAQEKNAPLPLGKVSADNMGSHSAMFSPYGYEFAEEIDNYNAAYPGYTSNHAVFSNLRVVKDGLTLNSPSLSWFQGGTGGLYNNNYSVGSTSSTFECWDTRY